MTRLKKVRQVLLYTLFLNLTVAVAKMIYGHVIGSISMLSDGIHSSADGASNVIGLIGIWIASQPPDESHPYGHRKFETLSTIAIAVLIFGAGTEILRKSYDRLHTPSHIEVTYVSFIVMTITLIVNIGVMLYEAKKGRELKSDFLIADSVHTKTDIFISMSVVISLIAAKIGYPVIDVLAALIITVFIAKMGYSILKSAAAVLTDTAQINPDEIKELADRIEGVIECHEIRTRGNEDSVSIDMHCLVDPEIPTRDAHRVAHAVEAAIRRKFPSVVDVVVHIEPYEK
ncbi:MAG TPA: cation transporter [Nitrospiraceae bacterium]|nr:cation transporter [Nitrospiraceae bacterium]